jgi:pimeloyl-ACP methyl ester carboxylesterase
LLGPGAARGARRLVHSAAPPVCMPVPNLAPIPTRRHALTWALCAPLAGCGGTLTRAVGARPSAPDWSSSIATQPHGTVFWGGSGLDGDYVERLRQALVAAGIRHVSTGQVDSASWNFGSAGMFVDALRAGTSLRSEDDGDWRMAEPPSAPQGQFNLIGYSYGSLLAAQTANHYAKRGFVVDHLVLVGSPIDAGFLATLRARPQIRRVIVVDLTDKGDPIYAGIAQKQLSQAAPLLARQMLAARGEGHFYYAHSGPEAPERWAALARELVAQGLR